MFPKLLCGFVVFLVVILNRSATVRMVNFQSQFSIQVAMYDSPAGIGFPTAHNSSYLSRLLIFPLFFKDIIFLIAGK